ncbi:MAG TPA: GNAT family N-acetyltransferase [Candidatus Eremiobacteraceae bacterium]|nr:GNAT family N-acetyltransferase [Candidatus Eremiobacteraceae bacterium]
MAIRPATDDDRDALWAVLEPVIRAGETYPLPRNMTREQAFAFWFSPSNEVFVWEEHGAVLATYFLKANQQGGGAHVANCGYVTSQQAQGRGIARAMCLHSLERAKQRGFRAIQFNFVVSSNTRAVNLWSSLGFQTVGWLPLAFAHPTLGFVDALVMFRQLP